MAGPKETVWELERHTAAKHQILRKYLGGWFAIMTQFNERVVYIDGFAGPGRYKGGEEGSPIIALNAALGQKQPITTEVIFEFIELEKPRAEHLESEVDQLQLPDNFKVEIVPERFDDRLGGILDMLDEQKATMAPAFAFIDPFGFAQTPFSVVQRLMENPKCEVLINFPYESTNRFLGHQDHPDTFDGLFGTPDWRAALDIDVPAERRRFLHDLFLRQLKEAAGIKYVRSFQMSDKGNRTEYFLFFGSNHLTGLRVMKDAMWNVDPSGQFQFSDFTNPNQPVLFDPDPDFESLKNLILEHFADRDSTVEEIREFVLAETPFKASHYKRHVLKALEDEDPPGLEIVKSPRKRHGTYPDGTVIRFLPG